MSRDRFTLEQLARRDARLAAAYGTTRPSSALERGLVDLDRALDAPLAAARSQARRPTTAAERMNGLEGDYAALLELQRRAGDVVAWHFGALRLELADRTWFRVDFVVVPAVIPAGFVIEAHETKGYMREAARVRLRVAARTYPWIRFRLVRRAPGRRGRQAKGLGAFTFEDVVA